MIIWFIIGIIVLIVGYFVLNYLYRHSMAYRNQLYDIQKLKKSIPDNLNVANLGSTYSMYAFNSYEQLKLNAFNFALDAQSLEIDNVILKKYSSKLSKSAVVILGLGACVPFYRYDMVNDKTKYYDIFNRDEIPNYSVLSFIRSKLLLSLSKVKSMISVWIKMNEKQDVTDGYPSYISSEQREKNMKSMADCWIKLFNLKNLKEEDHSAVNFANKQYNTKLLRSMLEYCIENNWKPVITIPPFSKDLNSHFGDSFINSVLMDMINEAKDGMDIPVMDYRTSPDFQSDYTSFVDGGFRLSKSGSKKFTKKLFSDLNSIGYCLNNKTIGL